MEDERERPLGGGTGNITAEGGITAQDIVTGLKVDIIVNNFGIAYQELRKALPEDHPAIKGLRESLRSFAEYHKLIGEWKELHNLLQGLLNAADPFLATVEQMYDLSAKSEVKTLRILWSPCQQRVGFLIGFARGIKHIWSEPYHEQEGTLHGPDWAVEIVLRQRHLEQMLLEGYDVRELYKLSHELSSVCNTHLYLADKSLHDAAIDLYVLSTGILARLVE